MPKFIVDLWLDGKVPFTIYQEFDNLTDFLNMRQTHIQNGLNVLCFA